MGEAGRLRDSRAPLLATHVGERLVPAGPAIRVVPARLREALVAASVCVWLILAASGRPEGQSGRLPLTLHGQVVVGGRGGVLVLEGGGRVRWVPPRLLRVPDDTRLGIVALGRDVQRRLRRVGAHGGGRGARGGGRRGGGGGRGGPARWGRVRLLVQRAAHAVHHTPPGRPGAGVSGRGRWRGGGRVAGRAEAPDMVVRVQGGGGASHGGALGHRWPARSRAERAHSTARRTAGGAAHEKKTRARFRPGRLHRKTLLNLNVYAFIEFFGKSFRCSLFQTPNIFQKIF